MFATHIPIWKTAPFIRFLLPLTAGIVCEYSLCLPTTLCGLALTFALLVIITSFYLPDFLRYKLAIVTGIACWILFFALGCILTWFQNIRNNPNWYGLHYRPGCFVQVSLRETPVEKGNSLKALATVTAVISHSGNTPTMGNLILYFKKDIDPVPDAGSKIIFSNSLLEIKNATNPGGFNYQQYCLFEDITHQVYLKKNDFLVLGVTNRLPDKILLALRKKVLFVLQHFVPGKKESGLAEALLIGYKYDLDQSLVQSYTRTGVVHIIAISGMHIALIYWLLATLCRPLKRVKGSRWLVATIIISGLWLFSLLAGAQASVVRSAVMFTCIVIGNNLSKRASIYNTLAASAFILLCYDPFWLWDVGFQLSYTAVLSIVIFSKPIYNLFYIKNKILEFVWKLGSVSIAAQLLTTPISVYHFHQFPNYFLITNLVAVPLSSAIVLGEIFLCAASPVKVVAAFSGKILSWLIWSMNSYIQRIENLPWSLWNGMQISMLQAALLLIIIAALARWIMEKEKISAWVAVLTLLIFISLRSTSFYEAEQQQKLIIYNVPKRQAIDIIDGRDYCFIGDSSLPADYSLINPSRVLFRTSYPLKNLPGCYRSENFLQWHSKKILLIGSNRHFDIPATKPPIDLLIVSKNPILHLAELASTFNIKQVVFDSSVPDRTIKYVVKDCIALKIPFYVVSETGAFVMNLN